MRDDSHVMDRPSTDAPGGGRTEIPLHQSTDFSFEALVNEVANDVEREYPDYRIDGTGRSALVRLAISHEREMNDWVSTAVNAESILRNAIHSQLVEALLIAREHGDTIVATSYVFQSVERRCYIVFFCWDWKKFKELLGGG